MECAICLGPVRKAAVGSCPHHFCHGERLSCIILNTQLSKTLLLAACLLGWLRTSTVCPKCREPVSEVRLDAEFDALVRAISSTSGEQLEVPSTYVSAHLYC